MGGESHREIVERYVQAIADFDLDKLEEMQHPDFVEEFPQSGERIRGRENFRKIHENYPGGVPKSEVRGLSGSEDEWVMTPSYTPLRVTGSGDVYTYQGVGHYPNGETWYGVSVIEVKDEKILKQTTYFGQPFEAPEWRAEWVERMS